MRGIALCHCQVCDQKFLLLHDCDTLREVQKWEFWASKNYDVCEKCWQKSKRFVGQVVTA